MLLEKARPAIKNVVENEKNENAVEIGTYLLLKKEGCNCHNVTYQIEFVIRRLVTAAAVVRRRSGGRSVNW